MIGSLITISSYSWLGMWMGLEINLLSFIPLMSSTKNSMQSEAAMKYFITQSIASMILLFSMIIIMADNIMINSLMLPNQLMIMNSAILMKMGAAPFHFWFPEIIEGLSWMNSFILMTWQKVAPMVILIQSMKTTFLVTTVIICSMIISGIMGINQTSIRKILAYSSINHVGWMISSFLAWQSIWLIYISIYSLISLNMIMILKTLNIFHIKQLINTMNSNKPLKMTFILNFLSLGGIPPFIGFLPKWLTINFLIEQKMVFISMIMIIFTLLTIFFYMRITFTTMVIYTQETSKKIHINYKIKNILILNMISLSSLLICTLLFNFS
uniref:NADH-ubiquinone oxidoreductase chain 2 n=2 Tax=Dermestes TaxID=219541 RepID=A0A6C0RVA6_9COLE|nr:NADH dehydrogenase subunit 2 [Dermestes tessellatocollis]QEK77720.1 NADH dehydrogenase subunit 2 [Dermestes tessellatocollis]QIA46733.1 NADH dehydrogenase subunit 2 [Dermestes maculatus]